MPGCCGRSGVESSAVAPLPGGPSGMLQRWSEAGRAKELCLNGFDTGQLGVLEVFLRVGTCRFCPDKGGPQSSLFAREI